MLLSTLLPLITLSLVSANGHASPPHRRHLARSPLVERHASPVERAGGPISNATEQQVESVLAWSSEHRSTEAATSTGASSAASTVLTTSTTSSAAESGQAGDTVVPPSSAVTTSSSVVPTTTSSIVTSSASPSPVVQETSVAVVPSSSVAPSSIVVSSVAPVPSVASSINNAPSTILVASSALPSTTTLVRSMRPESVVTATQTASASSTASLGTANDNAKEEKSGGLSKVALIAIIVVASVVGLGAILVFAIRKWKLGKSNRFDDRLKPIDFSPHNDGHDDDFLEKTLQRSGSRNSADMQRQQFVKELETDPNYVAGVPEHDFTAGNNAGYGAYNDTYNADPFAHAKAFDYEQEYYNDHAYPPAAAAAAGYDYPTQDQPEEGYANLQRGNSNGSDHAPARQIYTTDFPSPDNYLGRPTGGADGPYAQAAQYRY